MEFFPKKNLVYRTSLKKAEIFNALKNHLNLDNILLNNYKLNISDNSFSMHNYLSKIYTMGVVIDLSCWIQETSEESVLSVITKLKIEKKLFFYYILILVIFSGYFVYTWSLVNLSIGNFIIYTGVYFLSCYLPARLSFDVEARDLNTELEKIFENKLILRN